jgi:hypothetical protein
MSAVALGCAAEVLGGEGRLRRQRRPNLLGDRFLSLDTDLRVRWIPDGPPKLRPRIGPEN